MLASLGPRVEDLKASIPRCSQLEIVAGIGPRKVGNERLSGIVRRAAFVRKMKLPKICEARRLFDDVPGGRGPTLRGSVVHDGHSRRDAIQQRWAVALIPTMVRNDVDIDCAEPVYRAHQFHFFVPGQVAKIQNSQLAKCDYRTE